MPTEFSISSKFYFYKFIKENKLNNILFKARKLQIKKATNNVPAALAQQINSWKELTIQGLREIILTMMENGYKKQTMGELLGITTSKIKSFIKEFGVKVDKNFRINGKKISKKEYITNNNL